MTNPASAFAYTPNAGSLQFTVNGVKCALDFQTNAPGTEIFFDLLEIDPSTNKAWVMGVDSQTEGVVEETWQTPNSPLYDEGQALFTLANAQGIAMLTALKPQLNARLAARFPAGGTVEAPGSFTSDNFAMAWLLSQLAANFTVTGSVIT